MKKLKKYISTMLLLLLTIAPLNANLQDDLINTKELKKWCEQYVSKEKLDIIEEGLEITFILATAALLCIAVGGWVKTERRMHERAFKAKDPEGYKIWCEKNGSRL